MSVQTQTLSAPMDGDGESVRSRQVSAETLKDKVFAARNALHLTVTALASRTGMSPRTLRDIEEGVERTYRSTTLAPLDAVFGWEPGEAYRAWRATVGHATEQLDVADVAARLDELAIEFRRAQERPPWVGEWLDELRLMSADDRALLLAVARRMNRGL